MGDRICSHFFSPFRNETLQIQHFPYSPISTFCQSIVEGLCRNSHLCHLTCCVARGKRFLHSPAYIPRAASEAVWPAGQGRDSSPLLHSHETPPGMPNSVLGPQHKKDVDLLNQVQRRPGRSQSTDTVPRVPTGWWEEKALASWHDIDLAFMQIVPEEIKSPRFFPVYSYTEKEK